MNLEKSITTERVRILYERAFTSINTALAASLLIAYVLWAEIDALVLFTWLGVMFAIALLRYWLLFDYNKNKQNTLLLDKFEKRYSYATALVGISWAFIIVLGLNLPSFEFRLYGVLLLLSIVAIAAPIFSSSPKTMYFYLSPPLITTIPLLLSRGGNDTAVGLAVIVFTIMVLRTTKDTYKTLIDTLTLRYETQKQAEKLNQLRDEKREDDQRIQNIIDHAPAAIYVTDLDGHFIFFNQKVADLHHMQREQLIGKTLHDILPQDIADEIRQNNLTVISTKKTTEYEESAPQSDGLHHYISVKFPLFDDAGNVTAVGGVSTDITERFKIEESLHILQQRLFLHREQSTVGVIEWNTDFECIDWNPAAEKIFGFSKDEVQGHHITDKILPESARAAANKVWEQLLLNKGGFDSVNENLTKNGRTILCEWKNTPLVDEDGKVIGVTSLVDDITEREKTEENLRHSQKMEAIGQLTGGIAHDFNNMLGIVLGFANLLKGRIDNDDPKNNKYCENIIAAAERATLITSKLLDFSGNESSPSKIFYINDSLQDMRYMLESTITPRIELIFELEEKLWPVLLSKTQLEDTVLNICINSMHAMPVDGKLTLRTSNLHIDNLAINTHEVMPGDYVLLSIIDTGLGMTLDIQEKIFDPFFTTKGTEGTGLGLSQVYGFVQRSGGSIHVYSEPDHGTRVLLYFPRNLESESLDTKDEKNENTDIPLGKETIMVVDDQVVLLELAEEILTSNGYSVLCAESGNQALELLKDNSVDLLLSDVIMPGMNGYQLAEEVSKNYPSIKIQMLSGFSDDVNTDTVNHTLRQQLLHKPVSAELLLKQIRSLLDECM